MPKKNKTVLDQVLDYQSLLQGVANNLANRLAYLVSQTDSEVLKTLVKDLTKKKHGLKAEMERLQKIIAKIEEIRSPSYKASEDLILSTSADVIKAGTDEIAKEFNRALAQAAKEEREKRFCKTLTQEQQKAILDGQGIDGATIAEWFQRWQRGDLERIASAVQKASVEQLTIAEISKLIRGTKEKNYLDGILAATQVSAVRLARTIVNGVSNNARMETIKENSDVIDGVEFVGTLDGKTCQYCAAYDGHIWRGEDAGKARRPPLHPNCRCTIIPYVELKDENGNVVELEADRPAANADFDKLAKDSYNQQAREKGWSRRWEDLSASTRLKYFYKAQKNFEKETGKKAFEQVSGKTTFEEYFKAQPESFKSSRLGANATSSTNKGSSKTNKSFLQTWGIQFPSLHCLTLQRRSRRKSIRFCSKKNRTTPRTSLSLNTSKKL